MKIRAPNVVVLISALLVLVGALTWIVPAGRYEREERPGRQVVVQGSYQELSRRDLFDLRFAAEKKEHEKLLQEAGGGAEPRKKTDYELLLERAENGERLRSPAWTIFAGDGRQQGLWQVVQAPIQALSRKPHVAEVLGFILLIGGAFAVLQATGALVAAMQWLTARMGERRLLVVPVLMLVFSLGGATFGMAEESIAFVMITVPLAISMRFDTITGVAIPFVGSQVGFATAWMNPFTLGVAKGLADLRPASGEPEFEGYRLLVWLIATLSVSAIVTWHAWRVWQNPERSPTRSIDAMWRQRVEEGEGAQVAGAVLTARHQTVLVVFALTIAAVAYGGAALGWYIIELSGVFLAMAVLCGIAGGMSSRRMADTFMDGVKDIAPVAILVAFANGILILAEDGRIIDTVLYAASQSLGGVGETVSVWLMFLLQSGINFFVPSGSGQAALTIPLMAPLADVLNVSRDKAVLAYQFGDGFTNILIPTNPVLIGCIAAGKVEYATWVAWVWKPLLALFVLGFVALAVAPL